MGIFTKTLLQFFIEICIFLILTIIGDLIYKKIKVKWAKSELTNDLLPEDEVHTLRQVFYLILMALCFLNIFYNLTSNTIHIYYLVIFDIILSLYFAITIDKSTRKNKIIWLLLIPYGAFSTVLFNHSLTVILDILHMTLFLYMGKLCYQKFIKYTQSHGLGVAIILLFSIVFVSFIMTQYSEHVNALDALVMVSNSFTSNGYAVLGNSIAGKLNSVLLVWGGYVISGAGTATLTAAILTRHFNKRFDELEEKLIERDNKNKN